MPIKQNPNIRGYGKGYSIDEYGNVFSFKKNRYLKPSIDKDGYAITTLSGNGKSKKYKLHRLVAQYFLKGFSKKHQVNHKDFNKLNNHVSNLESSNHLHNQRHRWNRNNTKPYGACKHKGKWRVIIQTKVCKVEVGVFNNKDEAHAAFYKAYVIYHGVPPWNLE